MNDELDEWLLKAIREAKSLDRLKFLANVIKADSEAGEQYTKRTEYMNSLRSAWEKSRGRQRPSLRLVEAENE